MKFRTSQVDYNSALPGQLPESSIYTNILSSDLLRVFIDYIYVRYLHMATKGRLCAAIREHKYIAGLRRKIDTLNSVSVERRLINSYGKLPFVDQVTLLQHQGM